MKAYEPSYILTQGGPNLIELVLFQPRVWRCLVEPDRPDHPGTSGRCWSHCPLQMCSRCRRASLLRSSAGWFSFSLQNSCSWFNQLFFSSPHFYQTSNLYPCFASQMALLGFLLWFLSLTGSRATSWLSQLKIKTCLKPGIQFKCPASFHICLGY